MLGNRIKRARNYKGFNQEVLSEKLGISKRTLINYEQNEQEPTATTILNIAKFCNINEAWLLTGKGEMFLKDENSNSAININNSKNVVASTGNIVINPRDYAANKEIEELLEILKDVPKSWVQNMIDKLKKSLEAIDTDFK